MSRAGRIDWPVLLRAGLQGLRLSPEVFWRLTPAELALFLGQGSGRRPMTQAGLKTLLRRWPDETEESGNG
ncbi:rcc01693 family protein [Pseudodonghicola flavimaris]|uniref:Phage tail assembly chaperone n=1 Tax=Pseudodonghicola flavimaris TaxID=3050036 RepID=A0ABT7F3W6_9RHOB|nr:rcc01693 family protein [Pseudodonghicola flavimaris]MDK3019287.1 phage tail assembly chaperone [Pseudodonghicola flavimaris]